MALIVSNSARCSGRIVKDREIIQASAIMYFIVIYLPSFFSKRLINNTVTPFSSTDVIDSSDSEPVDLAPSQIRFKDSISFHFQIEIILGIPCPPFSSVMVGSSRLCRKLVSGERCQGATKSGLIGVRFPIDSNGFFCNVAEVEVGNWRIHFGGTKSQWNSQIEVWELWSAMSVLGAYLGLEKSTRAQFSKLNDIVKGYGALTFVADLLPHSIAVQSAPDSATFLRLEHYLVTVNSTFLIFKFVSEGVVPGNNQVCAFLPYFWSFRRCRAWCHH